MHYTTEAHELNAYDRVDDIDDDDGNSNLYIDFVCASHAFEFLFSFLFLIHSFVRHFKISSVIGVMCSHVNNTCEFTANNGAQHRHTD